MDEVMKALKRLYNNAYYRYGKYSADADYELVKNALEEKKVEMSIEEEKIRDRLLDDLDYKISIITKGEK